MELLQCPKDKKQHKHVKNFLTTFGFIVLPLTENIGQRAFISARSLKDRYQNMGRSRRYGGRRYGGQISTFDNRFNLNVDC